MRKLSRVLVSGLAVALILVRIFRPDIQLDAVTLSLTGLAISPWLKFIKGVEVPGGLKLDYQDDGQTTTKSERSMPSAAQKQIAKTEAVISNDQGIFGDTYLSRLVKLTPVEPIALFIIMSSLLQSTPTRFGLILQWSIFAFLLVMTPLFFRRVGVVWSQAATMTFAFCVWIFAIGGPFNTFHWYHSWYGGLVLGLFASLLPFFRFY